MPGESKTSPRRIAAVERGRQALELRIGGATFPQIAQQLKYANPSCAYYAVKAALNRVPAPEATTLRHLNLERLNRMRLLNQAALRKGDTKAIHTELAIQERETRYMGLDAPVKQEVSIPVPITLRVVYEELNHQESDQGPSVG